MNTPSIRRHRIIESPASILRLLLATITILALGGTKALADAVLADPVLEIDFDSMPPLPDGEGLAGAIAGRSGATIIIAGGANFPDEPRWETAKVWHDAVMVLDLSADAPAWTTLADRLHLGADQLDAGLEGVVDEVVVARLAVLDLGLAGLFGHGQIGRAHV